MINKLRNELLNKELSFLQLDNLMTNNNFYSCFEDDIIEYIHSNDEIFYLNIDTDKQYKFDIKITVSDDDLTENFYLKVLNIEEY